ncbi:LacI family DNA-binding transcriptional regulator [Anaerolinea sp.]|uniref:LacI family DNA-binding transcriptional regulator n=1 Tax=Anaerolinea sp. TaxID=1872519 RepID=UPI002ACDA62C|nr:LacI family DNA-binding transcriptional regulator [Anaerolinea sp.]
MKRSRPNIRDVAALAGVSHQTVSRVINGDERVTEETRQKVEAAILQLGYRPSSLARSMAYGRTFTLAFLALNFTDYTFSSMLDAAESEARQHNYFTLAISAGENSNYAELVNQLFGHQRVDGMIVVGPSLVEHHAELAHEAPVVCITPRRISDLPHTVDSDNRQGGWLATRHLLDLGHRKIGMITGPQNQVSVQKRTAGYCKALQESGVTSPIEWVIEGDWSATSGYHAFEALYPQGVSAIFAQNDRMAIGCIRAARDHGVNIPEDLSIIGFDDIPLASYFDPPLTTIRQDTAELGRQATRLLLELLKNPQLPSCHTLIPTQLIVRKSTCAFQERR